MNVATEENRESLLESGVEGVKGCITFLHPKGQWGAVTLDTALKVEYFFNIWQFPDDEQTAVKQNSFVVFSSPGGQIVAQSKRPRVSSIRISK